MFKVGDRVTIHDGYKDNFTGVITEHICKNLYEIEIDSRFLNNQHYEDRWACFEDELTIIEGE